MWKCATAFQSCSATISALVVAAALLYKHRMSTHGDSPSDATTPPGGHRRALVAAMILQYAVGGAIFPFLTLLLRDRGFTVSQISVVLLGGSVVMLVAPFFWGMLADRFIPLNRLLTVMNVLAVAALVALILQHDYLPTIVGVAIFYACFNPTPILVNLIAIQHLPDPHRQFGPIRAWGSAGWILPSLPTFVWLMLDRDQNLEFILWLTSGVAMAMAVAAWWLPRTAPGAARRQSNSPSQTYWHGLRQLLGNVDYLVVLGAYLLVAASFTIQAFYSPIRLEDLGMPRPWIGLVQSLGVVWEIFLFFGRAAIVNRLGLGGSVAVGCGALMARQLLFAGADSLWILGLSSLLVGTTVEMFHIGVNLIVAGMAGREVQSTAQTLLTLCSSGLGPILANGAVGRLTSDGRSDLIGVFQLGAVLAALAGGLLLLRRRNLTAANADRPASGPGR
jgi:PPP family 3-phenylpropionic acid transporter